MAPNQNKKDKLTDQVIEEFVETHINQPEVDEYENISNILLQFIKDNNIPAEYKFRKRDIAKLACTVTASAPAAGYYSFFSEGAGKSSVALFQGHPTQPVTTLNTKGKIFTGVLAQSSFFVNFVLGAYAFLELFKGESRTKKKKAVAIILSSAAVFALAATAFFLNEGEPAWKISINVLAAVFNFPLEYLGIGSAIDAIAAVFSSPLEKEKNKIKEIFMNNINDASLLKSFIDEYKDSDNLSINEIVKHFTNELNTKEPSLSRKILAGWGAAIIGNFLIGSSIAYGGSLLVTTGSSIVPLTNRITQKIFGTLTSQVAIWFNRIMLIGITGISTSSLLYLSGRGAIRATAQFYQSFLGSPELQQTQPLLENQFNIIKNTQSFLGSPGLQETQPLLGDQFNIIKNTQSSVNINIEESSDIKSQSLASYVAPRSTAAGYFVLFLESLFSYGSTYLIMMAGWAFVTALLAPFVAEDTEDLLNATPVFGFIFCLSIMSAWVFNFYVPKESIGNMAVGIKSFTGSEEEKKLIYTHIILKNNGPKITEKYCEEHIEECNRIISSKPSSWLGGLSIFKGSTQTKIEVPQPN